MADATARALVGQLQAQGWSPSAIGQALGRDGGQVRQIARDARGEGYGSHLVPGLRQLAQGATEAEVERRPQRVRQPVRDTPAGRIVQGTRYGPLMRQQIDRAAQRGQSVTVRAQRRDGSLVSHGWRKGGIDAGTLAALIDEHGGLIEAMVATAPDRYRRVRPPAVADVQLTIA